MSDYSLSPSALKDLIAAATYVSEKSGSPATGDRIIDRLAGAMEKLADFPTMGRARFDVRPRLRSFAAPPYVIFYRRKRNGVHVIRILHQRQDVEEAFPKRRSG